MFVIELVYKADLKDIDAHMRAHMAWLNKHYAAGTFVVSGRKIPRDGGIILAVGKSRAEIEAIASSQPFPAKSVGASKGKLQVSLLTANPVAGTRKRAPVVRTSSPSVISR